MDGGSLRYRLTPRNYADAYIINEPPGTAIEIEFSGRDDVSFQIVDIYGNELTDTETNSFSFVTRRYGPLFLILSQISEETTMAASHRLVQFDDPDRGRQIQVGQILHGNIDFPTNVDYFLLDLVRDEMVEIVVRSILADTQLTVLGYQGETLEVWIRDENSGGGLFGRDARIVFQAPQTGEYILGGSKHAPRMARASRVCSRSGPSPRYSYTDAPEALGDDKYSHKRTRRSRHQLCCPRNSPAWRTIRYHRQEPWSWRLVAD